jgi:hypothetical protein
MQEARKRDKGDQILEMTSIFKKLEDFNGFKNDMAKTLFSLSTIVACIVEKEALTVAFESERDKKIQNQLQELKKSMEQKEKSNT